MSGESEQEPLAPDHGNEVLIFQDEFGILVQGPSEAASSAVATLLEERVGGTVARSTLTLGDAAAVGATGNALAASSGEYLRLTADGLAKVREFGFQHDSGGAVRGYVRDSKAIAGQLTFEPVTLAAEQALALQTAAVSLALRSAIANVQKAVERVEGKVDAIGKHLKSRLQGDVLGTYRLLTEIVDATNRRGHLLDADWASVAGERGKIVRDLETLRTYAAKEADSVTLRETVPEREKRFSRMHREDGHVADVLSLILVAEQSLHLYEYLRLQRVRAQEAEHVESAVDDAKSSLAKQLELDKALVARLRSAIERGRVIEPLEIHRVLSKKDLERHARAFDKKVLEFASSARLDPLDKLAKAAEPGLVEARDELKERTLDAGRTAREVGSAAAKESRKAVRKGGKAVARQVDRIRRETRD